ncbi:pyridoxal-dependent decarboxylase [Phascolomyces articulosus]|uniref:ornithine decarboxylase n=1 Tax=Phascolomyces articulosus TaxID=60185 RepID=A0AAD5KNW6_9FUNG|nr:pyridoxal-dependent decarboxylase [Phascolomyces articulosus]
MFIKPFTYGSNLQQATLDNKEAQLQLSNNNTVTSRTDYIKYIIKNELESRVNLNNHIEQDDCFFVLDLGQLYRQHQKWKRCLPRIKPYYAVKCNSDQKILEYLTLLGVGFDCASGFEIQKALQCGADPSNIIYAHTCKQASYLQFAAENGVRKMTFDSVDELYKTKKLYPNAELLLRILTDDSKAKWGIGLKYGAPMADVDNLLQTAKTLDLNIVGVSFHVGSGCSDAGAYHDTLRNSRIIFDRAKQLGFNCNLLDIGGGFFGVDYPGKPTFEQITSVIREAVDQLFPHDVQVIAEPGRYYATSTLTVCCQVVGRKLLSELNEDNDDSDTGNKTYAYYVNDILHSSFATRLFYSDVIDLRVLMKNGVCTYGNCHNNEQKFSSRVWGHTDEPGDCLSENARLPLLNIGDWIYAENLGAYAITTCHFSGFERPKIIYVDSKAYHH